MTKDKELEQSQAEKTALCEALRRKDEELDQSRQANQDLREGPGWLTNFRHLKKP